ncbi:MAG: hypothetical protein QOF71_2483 [Candidatus Eremiobacteraeota bacterium]|jgi:hypothetical protein|nr:hypothetical protein [Candidatus Eremiobacteraeota bacterium]
MTFAQLCVFAAACSGGVVGLAPSAAVASSANACALLSPGDVHGFFGKSWVVISRKATPPEKSHCTWGPPGSYGSLTVQVVSAGEYVNGDANLPGIGDKAALDDLIGMWRGRAVKGKNAVNFFTSSKGVSRTTALEVLKRLVARM